jgi:anti-sigma regulatory factor (Ser/Thr protein kinase)/HAMP domain-containing protein
MKLQWKMALIVAGFGLFAVFSANAILYQFLIAHDLTEIKKNARQTANLIRIAILNTMVRTGDYDEIASIINEMRKSHDFEFGMIRSEHVIKQHGVKRDEIPKDEHEQKALSTGEIVEIMDSKSILRIIYPFLTDQSCGGCHIGLNGEPVPSGIVNGAAVIRFDISKLQADTDKIIFNLMISMSIISGLFFTFFLLVVNRTVSAPMTRIAEAITGLKDENYDVDLPEYSTTEIEIMARDVESTAHDLAEKKRKRDSEIEAASERTIEIERFIRSRAEALGLEDDTELTSIVGRLSTVVDEAQKGKLSAKVSKYIVSEQSRLKLPSDPDLIPAVSIHLLSLVEANPEAAKTVAVELAIDEALSNAIYHGNLEVPSRLKTDDFEKFYELADERMHQEPYSSRTVNVQYKLDGHGLEVTIEDQGQGFDWRKLTQSSEGDTERPHGRGLTMMQEFASRVEFNEKGNRVSLFFDFDSSKY